MKFELADVASFAFGKDDTADTLVARVLFFSHESHTEVGSTTITVETRLHVIPNESMDAARARAAQAAMALLSIDFGPRPARPDPMSAFRRTPD